MIRLVGIALVVIASACTSAPVEAEPKPESSIIEYDPNIGTERDGRAPAWLAYGLARRLWIDSKFFETHPDESVYRYTFEEEVYARETLAKVWYGLHEKEGVSDYYLSQLANAERSGFIREYVWACLSYRGWEKPPDLRQREFSSWFAVEIPDHRAETRASVQQRGDKIVVSVGPSAHAPVPCARLAE
jgi:hypothetical protein